MTSTRSRAQAPGLPLSTWLFGSAAVLITVAAGVIFFQEKPRSPADPPQANEVAEPGHDALETPDPTHDPLDLSGWLIDAQERARIWSGDAMLATIEVELQQGTEVRELVIEYGSPRGRPLPGVDLGKERLTVRYRGLSAQSEETTSETLDVGLVEPNCPLGSAIAALRHSGMALAQNAVARYVHSEKHQRAVWLVTTREGEPQAVDARQCTIFTR